MFRILTIIILIGILYVLGNMFMDELGIFIEDENQKTGETQSA